MFLMYKCPIIYAASSVIQQEISLVSGGGDERLKKQGGHTSGPPCPNYCDLLCTTKWATSVEGQAMQPSTNSFNYAEKNATFL